MTPLAGISSMATRPLLAELVAAYRARGGGAVEMTAVGGVDAARRVQAGEPFDLVILAADAVERLIASGRVQPGSRVDLVRSPVAVAVRAGAPRPDIGSEDALRRTVQAAASIGYSTGPSGQHLARLFERWGIAEELRARTVTPPPGVPVGQLVAEGSVALGFQQLSELMHLDGVDVVGTLPAGTDVTTTFSAGLCTGSARADEVRALLDFLASPDTEPAKRRHGMAPA